MVSRSMTFLALAATLAGAPALAAPARTPAIADFSTCPKPVWPAEALQQKQHGTVTLNFLIDEKGAVGESRVQQSSGFSLLDVAAREGLMKCRFRAATVDGQPVKAWMKIQYVWTLEPERPGGAFDKAALAAKAGQGDAKAQVALARHYLNVQNADRDPQRAVELLRSAAASGDTAAMEMLASILGRGTIVAKDTEQALALLRRAADSGAANAQHALGHLLLRGESVPKDEKAGEAWLRKAAAQGKPQSQLDLAVLLRSRGPATDEVIALLKGAAARSNPVALRLLGEYNEQGTAVPQDYATAAELYRKAAAAGDNPAKEGLARLYEKGRGVPLDKAVADALYADAAASALASAQVAAQNAPAAAGSGQ